MLAINGTLDTQIDCAYNLVALDNGLVNSQRNIVYYQGLNHLLQHCRTGLNNEYLTIEETISPDVLQNIINWVMSITKKSAE